MIHRITVCWKLLYTMLLCTILLSPAALAESIQIKSSRQATAEIVLSPSVNITYSHNGVTENYRAENKGDKHKYFDSNNQLQAEIKVYPDKLKLRAPSLQGEVVVKGNADKTKIVINDDEEHPVAIKFKSGKFKVYQIVSGGAEILLGQVQSTPDNDGIKIKNADKDELFRIKGARPSSIYGLLLDDRLPPHICLMLMAEMLQQP